VAPSGNTLRHAYTPAAKYAGTDWHLEEICLTPDLRYAVIFGFRFAKCALRFRVLPSESLVTEGRSGEVAEWSNAPDSKSGVPQGTGGSNPSLSASFSPLRTRRPEASAYLQ
jgi:hypothetical protein